MAIDYIEKARQSLERGDYEAVRNLESSNLIKQAELSPLINTAFAAQCRNKNYAQAVTLGKAFHLPANRIREAVEKGFSELINTNEFDRAIEWGNRNGMTGDEIRNAAEKYCRECLVRGEIEKALEIKKAQSLSGSAIKEAAREAMNKAVENNKFEEALLLTEECDVPAQFLMAIITRLLLKYAAENNKKKILAITQKHKFLTEETFGSLRLHEQMEMLDVIGEKLLKKFLYEDEFEFLASFIKETEILTSSSQNPQLMKLKQVAFAVLGEIHKTYLLRENTADAIKTVEEFDLLDATVPKEFLDAMMATARKFHTELLKRGNLEGAIRVSEYYKLNEWDGLTTSIYLWDDPIIVYVEKAFAHLDVENAGRAIDAYHIAKDQVENIVKRMLRAQMEEKNFRFVFELLKKFRISSMDKDLVSMAENFFDDLVKENQFETAADMGYYFKLRQKVTRPAAFQAWAKKMKLGRLDEARELKNKHRLPAEMMEGTARETYQYYMNINPETAKRIREEYNIDLNFWEVIAELLKKILRMPFPSRKI